MVGQHGVGTSLGAFGHLHVPLRRRVGALLLVVVVVMVTAFVIFNGEDRAPTPLGVEIRNPTTLVLLTTCADDVTAGLTESADSVHLHAISGYMKSDDCAGGLEIELSAPIADRTLIVEGNEWNRVDASCPYGDFGPGGADVPPACR